ncbi:MAG TPA: protease inhibitor I42 family protein [Candidatus Baltobacteraceae bacterium]|jgi:predicted secreted protein|nr:protease inhibitor I42 family protein [Candidatus Baltobacteraceae bacterium]
MTLVHFLLFTIVLAAASPAALPTVAPAVMHAAMPTFNERNSWFTAHAGAPFQIRMTVTSGTGYTWEPVGPLPPGVTLLGVFAAAQARSMPGSPSREVLVFRAANAGTAHLKLAYVRPWERSTPPAKTAAFTIRVQ